MANDADDERPGEAMLEDRGSSRDQPGERRGNVTREQVRAAVNDPTRSYPVPRDVRDLLAQLLDERDALEHGLDVVTKRLTEQVAGAEVDDDTRVFFVTDYTTYESWSEAKDIGKRISFDQAVKQAMDKPMTSRHQVVEVNVTKRVELEYSVKRKVDD